MSDPTPPFPLSQLRRWCRWALLPGPSGKPTKKPDQSTADLDLCRTWDDVAAVLRTPQEGVGVVVTGGIQDAGLHYLALDLDECVNGTTISPWAREVLAAYPTYTETSPSGRGLRMWLSVQDRPTLAKSLVKFEMGGGAKCPQLQVFGVSRASSYVTYTGHRIGERADIARFGSLRWLVDRFGLAERPPVAPLEPTGVTSLDAIDAKLRAHHHGRLLVDGAWQAVLASGSASEAYHMLVGLVLQVTGGNTAVTIDYLLTRTVWGQGEVEGSIDPGKYAKRTWVERDVARAVGKGTAAAPEAPFSVESGRLIGSVEFLRRRADQRFLIDGLLPRTGLAQMFGDPGCGKTPFAMSLALHVAAKQPTWFGRAIERTGTVVYLVGEDSNGLGWRLEAELASLGLRKGDIDSALLWSTQPGRLGDSADVALWEKEIRGLAPHGPALIVVDTQSRNFGDGDENSTQDMTRFVTNLANLADRMGCLILLVHHTGHTAKERARGSSVLYGAIDALFRVSRDGSRVSASAEKCKNWERPDPLEGELVPRTLGTDSRGRPVTAITLRPLSVAMFGSERLSTAVATLDSDKLMDAVVTALREGEASVADLTKTLKLTPTRTRSVVARMQDLDLLTMRRSGKDILYALNTEFVDRIDEVRRTVADF